MSREAMTGTVPETIYQAVERVLDEHSAWIARPSPDVTKAVALAAGIAWSLQAERQQSNLVKCAVSHLPAGHPNACNDCDPCIGHDRTAQIESLMYDWERLYWEARRLQEEAAGLLMENLALKQNAENDSIDGISSDPKAEIMRLMREEFDPTPPGWEGRDWDDNAEDVASKIIAAAMSEKLEHISDAWNIVKQWLADYAAEEAAFSRYRDDVMLDGVMTAGTMRALNDALYVQAEADRNALLSALESQER